MVDSLMLRHRLWPLLHCPPACCAPGVSAATFCPHCVSMPCWSIRSQLAALLRSEGRVPDEIQTLALRALAVQVSS